MCARKIIVIYYLVYYHMNFSKIIYNFDISLFSSILILHFMSIFQSMTAIASAHAASTCIFCFSIFTLCFLKLQLAQEKAWLFCFYIFSRLIITFWYTERKTLKFNHMNNESTTSGFVRELSSFSRLIYIHTYFIDICISLCIFQHF